MTIGHNTYPVPEPFLVLATQNPIESEGTYPLPEAQVDRFMLKVLVDYPAHDEELTVVARSLEPPPSSSRCSRSTSCKALQAKVGERLRRPGARSAGSSTSRPRRASRPSTALAVDRAVRLVRREPARADLADRRRARAGAPPRPRLRARRRHRGARPRRVPAPARALLPGARRGGRRRPGPRRGARRRSRRRRSTSARAPAAA